MKKLSKKQKIIGVVALLLLAVILAIVITTNITRNNSQLSNERYLATTANAGSDLVASYIKSGITIGGITGTLESLNTSDATATPEDITLGKTAYVDGEKITGTRIPTSNYDFKDSLGNVVKVPGGFKVVNQEENVTDGIVIEDVSAGDSNTKGSQFVWIPVGNVITEDGTSTTIQLGRYEFAESTGKPTLVQSSENWEDTSDSVEISYSTKELATSSYGNATAKNLGDFIEKATTSGGYYIGRYEAGDATATRSARTSDTRDSNPMVCRLGVYPYTYINQLQASGLCGEMYSSSNFESDLTNSYAWDTAIVFIQTFSGDENYSRQLGKNTANELKKCGESILANVDSGDNSQDVRCNIYDMSGNTQEFSTETSSFPGIPCVARASYCSYSYTLLCTSSRTYSTYRTNTASENVSARPILYL